MADIRLYPYISSPHGIEVCYSINGGPIRQKRFPAGTSREAIIAALEGHPLAPADHSAEIAAKNAEEKAQRAAAAQPEQTASEDQLKQQDSDKDAKIADKGEGTAFFYTWDGSGSASGVSGGSG